MTIYTQVPGSLDLSGVIGDDWNMGLDFDIVLTGYTWEAAVVNNAGTSVAAITVTVDDATNGLMTLSIADTLTDMLNEKAYRWYLKQTNAGSERVWLAGNFRWYKPRSGRFGSSSGTTVTVAVASARGTQGAAGAAGAQGAAGPQGASGASGLLWDTVSYTVGTLSGDDIEAPWQRDINIILKNGATEITEDTIFFTTLLTPSNTGLRLTNAVELGPEAAHFNEYLDPNRYILQAYYYTHGVGGITITAQAQSYAGTTFNLVIFKPNGGIEKIEVVLELPD